jgi:hypothetical protein
VLAHKAAQRTSLKPRTLYLLQSDERQAEQDASDRLIALVDVSNTHPTSFVDNPRALFRFRALNSLKMSVINS